MKNINKSIRERLLNLSKAQDQNFNTLLTQYALQRLLYRLNISEYCNQFVLLVCPLTFAELVTKIELFIQPIYQQIGTGLRTTKQWDAHTWSWK